MTIEGPPDGKTFCSYVKAFLLPTFSPGDFVVMDNSSVHKNVQAREALEKAGVGVIWTPPYSPEFNPIEECWSKVKAFLKALRPRNRPEIEEGLKVAASLITLTDVLGWFGDSEVRLSTDEAIYQIAIHYGLVA